MSTSIGVTQAMARTAVSGGGSRMRMIFFNCFRYLYDGIDRVWTDYCYQRENGGIFALVHLHLNGSIEKRVGYAVT